MQKIIQDVLRIVGQCADNLSQGTWMTKSGQAEVCQLYKNFKEYVALLVSVIRKLTTRGYPHHLQELLLLLTYKETS